MKCKCGHYKETHCDYIMDDEGREKRLGVRRGYCKMEACRCQQYFASDQGILLHKIRIRKSI